VKYSEFTDQIMISLYRHDEQGGGDIVQFRKLAERYGLQFRPGWLLNAQKDLQDQGLVRGPNNSNSDDNAAGRLTGPGLRFVEELIDTPKGEETYLAYQHMDDLDREPSGSDSQNIVAVEAQETVSASDYLEASIIPAADRLVRLDHNQPQYAEISKSIIEVIEAVRTTNDLGIEPDERDRVLRSLEAASSLWEAVQLKAIQFKVGILMAVEDAAKALKATAKATAAALLVDAIKSFAKTHIGLDLDNL